MNSTQPHRHRENAVEATAQGESAAEVNFSGLIDQMGRLRMLSHRVGLFVCLCNSNSTNTGALAKAEEALGRFEAGLAAVTDGLCEQKRNTSELGALVAELGEELKSPQSVIVQFVNRARSAIASLAASTLIPNTEINSFVDLISAPLLDHLNDLNGRLAGFSSRQQEIANTRVAENTVSMRDTTQQIAVLSLKVKVISLNASIEAARAGPAGASFAVIAGEVRKLSEATEQAAQELRSRLEHNKPTH